MQKLGRYMVCGLLAAAVAGGAAFPAAAKEERTPVGEITLSFSVDVSPGEAGGTVDVTVESGECSVESVDFVKDQDYWVGGERPKVEIWLSADSDYYFKKSGKSAFVFEGDEVKYVSASAKNDKEEMLLRVSLGKLDEDDEDLSVDGLSWDEDNGIAHWETQDTAKTYRVRLCRSSSSSAVSDGLGSTYTVTENSFDFSGKIPKAGSYYFKVRAIDARGNAGDWEESPYMEVTAQELAQWKGTWSQDSRGWRYTGRDGLSAENGWREIGGVWYFFGADGYMKTGWITWEGKEYYCDASGAMLTNTTTPDGFYVGADGAKQSGV